MREIGKDIEGYEGLYQISNYGRVKSLNYNKTGKERILKPGKITNGYYCVNLCKNRKVKLYYIHRLIAEAFIENSENKPEVNHKNEWKWCNCIWNLEWCTHEYNVNGGTRNKRSSDAIQKPIICIETGVIYQSITEASELLLTSKSNICNCLKGRRKTAGGFHGEYKESC